MFARVFPPGLAIDTDRVEAAIAAAERRCAAEIRVVVSRSTAADPVAAAEAEFERLGMTATAARNGVLIFLAPRSRTFAIVGDEGVHAHCGAAFWDALAATMEEAFRRDDFTAGIVLGVGRAGELLATCFPRADDDRDELPDRVEIV